MSSLKERNVAAKQTTASRDVEWVPSICNFCSTVCNVRIGVKDVNGKRTAVKIEGNSNSPLNRGKTCARGQAGLKQTYDEGRLTTPLIRVEGSKRGNGTSAQLPGRKQQTISCKNFKNIRFSLGKWPWPAAGLPAYFICL